MPTSAAKTKTSLPSISVLLEDSFGMVPKFFLSFAGLNIIQFVIMLVGVLGLILVLGLLTTIGGVVNLSQLSNAVGGAATNPAEMSQVLAAIGPMIGISIVVFILALGYLGSAWSASMIFLLGKSPRPTVGQSISAGFRYAPAVFLTALIAWFITMGATFFFILPGILASIFCMFVGYEVVLADKKYLEAIKSSVNVVSQYFWEILGRAILIGILFIGMNIILGIGQGMLSSVLGKNYSGIVSILGSIFSMALTLFNMAVGIVLYRQVKAVANKSSQGSMTWMWVVSGLGWVIAVLLAGTIFTALATIAKDPKFAPLFSEMTQSATPAASSKNLEGDVMTAINTYREKNKLKPLVIDTTLCAYNQRRLGQLKEFGKFDDNKGWLEDTNDKEVMKTYFSKYSGFNYHLYGPVGRTNAEAIVANWLSKESDTNKTQQQIKNSQFTHGCVRAGDDVVMFLGGIRN